MTKICYGYTSMNSQCRVQYGLNTIILKMPEKEDPEIRYMCQDHCKILINELQYIENGIKLQVKELNRKFDSHKVSSESMMIVGVDKRTRELKARLEEKLKAIRWNECRELNCLKPIEQNEYLCSMIILSSRGKFRSAFYFHRDCFDKIRARCGIRLPIHQGQYTLEQSVTV